MEAPYLRIRLWVLLTECLFVWIGHLQGCEGMRRVFGPDLMIQVISWPELRDCTHFLWAATAD
jgi:hypothetical protein